MRGYTGHAGRMAVALGLAAALAAPAAAQDAGEAQQDEGDAASAPAPDAAHKEGQYTGVVPGHAPPLRRPTRRPIATWIGFQPTADGSRLFVQLTRDAEFHQQVAGDTLVVTIEGARFGSRNVRRRLDTRFFPTPVREVVPKPAPRRGKRRAGIALHIAFKAPGQAREAAARLEAAPDGYHYLFLDFGPGEPTAAP